MVIVYISMPKVIGLDAAREMAAENPHRDSPANTCDRILFA